MATQLNYQTSEALASPHGSVAVSWSVTGNFDYENVKMNRLAFDADRCIPPRQGQLFPVLVPLHTI